ncbi:MAG: hypothetical protein LBR06_09385 [Bacteroidales bacterium]|jgi:alpha-L-rhamnosidase|nr:hypothetical protein [Bacteroidales bacterium]
MTIKLHILNLLLFFNVFLYGAEVANLRCEYQTETPRFSWVIKSMKRGDRQTAYQLIVSSSESRLKKNEGDMWNSGKQHSEQSIHIQYNGKNLLPAKMYYWKVRVWDKNGKATEWSNIAKWSMGLLTEKDWQGAKWIAFKDSALWVKEWQQHKESELKGVSGLRNADDWPWFTDKDSSIKFNE